MNRLALALAAAGLMSLATSAVAEVCVSSTCGQMGIAFEQPRIFDAENILFTDTGRLFVSGGHNVYVILPDGYFLTGRKAVPLFAGSANFTGLAQIGSTLYALSFDGTLYALNLIDGSAGLVPIHKLAGMPAANGMVDGPDGELYIVNGPLPTSALPDPKIVRVRLDPTNPQHVVEQVTWLQGGALLFPNGLTRRGRTLYLTDHNGAKPAIGWIGAIDILADRSPGALRQIAHFPSIPDDLTLDGDDFIVAEYSSGTVARFAPDGKLRSQLRLGTILGASSVEVGRPPLYKSSDLLITQKGVIGVDDGDRLVVWHHN